MIQHKPVHFSALLLAVFLITAAACGGAKETVSALKGPVDEAATLLTRQADPAELTNLSSRLKGLANEVPPNAELSSEERHLLNTANQRAAVLEELAGMFTATESVKGLINKESVTLVGGAFIRKPTEEFDAKLKEAAVKILRDTACNAFYKEMNTVTSTPASGIPTPEAANRLADETDIYNAFKQAIEDANFSLASALKVVHLSGLSNSILETANGYVGKVKKTVTATAWNNGGATRAYLQVCVFNK